MHTERWIPAWELLLDLAHLRPFKSQVKHQSFISKNKTDYWVLESVFASISTAEAAKAEPKKAGIVKTAKTKIIAAFLFSIRSSLRDEFKNSEPMHEDICQDM